MLLIGNLVAVLGMALSIFLFWKGYFHPLTLFGCTAFTGLGNGITLPNANAGIVSVKPHLAGSASGLGGSLQIGGGAVLAAFTGTLLSAESGPYPLLWVMLVSSVLGVFSTLYIMHVARTAGEL